MNPFRDTLRRMGDYFSHPLRNMNATVSKWRRRKRIADTHKNAGRGKVGFGTFSRLKPLYMTPGGDGRFDK